MQFKDITTWTISADHKARPKNPYEKPMFTGSAYEGVSNWTVFEQFATQHTYACSPTLVAGDYPAEDVELVWQIRYFHPHIGNFYDWQSCSLEYAKSSNSSMEETRQYLQLKQPRMKNENKQPEWVNITPDNLPPHLQVCEWLHPEYGVIIGNIVKYGGKLESEQSLWIFPVGGCEADIVLSEFAHFRKVIQQPASSPESKEVESDKSIYDYWMEKYPNGSNIHSQFKIFKTGFRGGKKSTESKILHFINSLEGLNGQSVQWYEGYFAFKKDLFNLLGATEKTEAPITSPIEVIKKRLEELDDMQSCEADIWELDKIKYAINELNHILKLLQA